MAAAKMRTLKALRGALSVKSVRKIDTLTLTIAICTLALILFGVVMVMSASSVTGYLANRGLWGEGAKHAGYALLALLAMLFAAAIKPATYKRLAPWAFGFALFLQTLVFTPLGFGVWGNRNWLQLGPVQLQPSELLKLTLILMLAAVILRIKQQPRTVVQQLVPVLVYAGLALGLIMAGRDLGTASVVGLAVFGCMIFGNLDTKTLLIFMGAAMLAALGLVATSPNRVARILSFSSGSSDYTGLDWQPLHGQWAIASGGLTGSGLGSSKAKWSWLPAADNDYIFAIIGEETGLLGCLLVVAVYVILAVALIKLIARAKSTFQKSVVGGIFAWIIGQAFVNIAVVLRIFPVLGVPLPLISAGGTALVVCCAAMGVVISIARDTAREEELNA